MSAAHTLGVSPWALQGGEIMIHLDHECMPTNPVLLYLTQTALEVLDWFGILLVWQCN